MRQKHRRYLLVVGEEVALSDPVVWEEDAVGAAETNLRDT
jgi:hypothetical protein